jgi:hypothetical protein
MSLVAASLTGPFVTKFVSVTVAKINTWHSTSGRVLLRKDFPKVEPVVVVTVTMWISEGGAHSASVGVSEAVLFVHSNVLPASAEETPTNAIAATAVIATRPNILMSLTVLLPSRRRRRRAF